MKLIAKNKKAYFNYEIIDTLEAGIELRGSEVKSIKEGRISLKESYSEIKDGEAFLINCHISPYEAAFLIMNLSERDGCFFIVGRSSDGWARSKKRA